MDERFIEESAACVDLERDVAVARVKSDLAEPGASDCADCGAEIPAARRAAAPFATRCIACQSRFERSHRA